MLEKLLSYFYTCDVSCAIDCLGKGWCAHFSIVDLSLQLSLSLYNTILFEKAMSVS
jgi:hypothetical protein